MRSWPRCLVSLPSRTRKRTPCSRSSARRRTRRGVSCAIVPIRSRQLAASCADTVSTGGAGSPARSWCVRSLHRDRLEERLLWPPPLTLDNIEHDILRPLWQDNRIHYAVNCASLGCPNLAPEVYTADNLERLLDQGARDYVNHPRGVEVLDEAFAVVSSIYYWYLLLVPRGLRQLGRRGAGAPAAIRGR